VCRCAAKCSRCQTEITPDLCRGPIARAPVDACFGTAFEAVQDNGPDLEPRGRDRKFESISLRFAHPRKTEANRHFFEGDDFLQFL
jgi:hypothetical protein